MDEQAVQILTTIGNQHLIAHWYTLNDEQKHHLFRQLQKFDPNVLQLQQRMVHSPQIEKRSITPFSNYTFAGNQEDRQAGFELISQGKVGCLIVAGGQGTRLHIDGPKGKCQVSKICKKSLFQLFAEKTLAAGKQANCRLPIAIMTSPLNHEETLAFFEVNAFFGLQEDQIFFFKQGTLPMLSKDGTLFLETIDTLAEGPDGNGGALQDFVESGIWKDWHSQGIRYLNFVLVDNPLADPFDAELIGFQARMQSDVAIKCIKRSDPNESVGILVQENSKPTVIEYTELSEEERTALNPDGSLYHPLANLSLFSFSMDFVLKAHTLKPTLHKAFKTAKYLDDKGMTIQAQQPIAWKFEKFIFDVIPFAKNVVALAYPRETCFAPLKNFKGKDSFETVADAIEKRDQQVFSSITGIPCRITPFEISQDFYYPTHELIQKWRGKSVVVSGYLEC